ncbi:TetR/AcrR family transcriptional regulator [Elioraea sp. Yellowstone]|jgi:AcrR family transcriptional regulator|nr:TetR/AcrR family transcriptional regulator [Elioraea sp. Yellowstone]
MARTAAGRRPAAKPRRRSAADRRRQVVAAARRIVLREGFEALTMRRVAALAGVSAAALYLYFPDRLSLMAAVADDLFEGLLAAMRAAVARAEGDPDPRARLHAVMTAYLDWGLTHPDEYRVIFMTPITGVAGHQPGEPGVPAAPTGQATFAALQAEVARLIALGVFRPAEPQVVAEAIWAAGHGLVSLLITKPGFPWSPRDRLIGTLADALCRGFSAG